MTQTQFISHAQVVPPTLVPRHGMGVFGALAIVIAILAGVATGALILLQQSMQEKVNTAKTHLAELHEQMEIPSINQAQLLQQRIESGYSILNQHVYSSQAFNFVEDHILEDVDLRSFGYVGPKVRVDLRASSYLIYAQQIRYFRKLVRDGKIVSEFAPSAPVVTTAGDIDFSVEVALSDIYIHSKPDAEVDVIPPAPSPSPVSDNSTIDL